MSQYRPEEKIPLEIIERDCEEMDAHTVDQLRALADFIESQGREFSPHEAWLRDIIVDLEILVYAQRVTVASSFEEWQFDEDYMHWRCGCCDDFGGE